MKTVKKKFTKVTSELFVLSAPQLQSIRGGDANDTPQKDQDELD
jgi:hypothetical protein